MILWMNIPIVSLNISLVFAPIIDKKNEGISTFVTVKPEIMSFYRRKILQIFISLALTGSPKMTTKFIRGSLKLQ